MDTQIRLLLVEDDKIDQIAFARMVEREGLPYAYSIAGSVAEAQELLEVRSFDVIIVDYLLQDGTAFDLLDAVSDVPVVFTTGAGDEETAVRALKSGAADYLIKDVNRNYLKMLPVTVQNILRYREDQRAIEELRDAMIHMLVHDLRNPLGAIYTALKISLTDEEDPLSENHIQVLQIALNNAEKMQEIVNSILDVSKLESGQMLLDLRPAPLREVVEETAHQLSTLAEEKRLQLELDVPTSLPLAWMDDWLVGRVLQNLLDNAIKFTPEGGTVRIAARALPQSDEHQMLRVSVSDSGSGIPEEIRGHLFEKFVAGRQKGHGTGLGLAFCKLVVEAHEGEISVESEAGEGATVVFTLPVTPDDVYQEVMSG
jgi:signal transduction histidine kinase